MKSCTKTELARAAGVSPETFRRWLKTDQTFLCAHGVGPTSKILPPKVVQYLCDKYAIDLPPYPPPLNPKQQRLRRVH